MNIAICSATPYQTLNAVNLACNVLEQRDRKELFYRNFSDETDKILMRLKKYDIFDEIHPYVLKEKRHSLGYYFNDFLQAAYPQAFARSVLSNSVDLSRKNYGCLTVTAGTEMEVALFRIFQNARLIAYDDGIGSYVGDIVHDHHLRFIWRLLGRRTDKIWPEVLYVNNASLCRSKLCANICQLPKMERMSDDYMRMIYDVFGFAERCSFYRSTRLVYLTQPYEELGASIRKNANLIENVIQPYRQNCVIRIHPRDMKANFPDNRLDRGETLWELICENEITDSHVLLCLCSSAAVMPKVLFDKEPWIIFAYRLFSGMEERIEREHFNPLISIIKSSYRDKQKVIVPETANELQAALSRIME